MTERGCASLGVYVTSVFCICFVCVLVVARCLHGPVFGSGVG